MTPTGTGRALRLAAALFAIAVLPGCATIFSPLPAAGPDVAPLRIASWNLAHLTPVEDGRCRRASDADYLAARRLAEALDADVIAFQQAEDERAAQRVFAPERFTVIMERRGRAQRISCQAASGRDAAPRATGVAVRRGLSFAVLGDLSALRLGRDDLTSGVDIVLRPHGRRYLRLLSFDLAGDCRAGSEGASCFAWRQQAAVLDRWIASAERLPTRFLLFGAWNRRLDELQDPLIAQLGVGQRQDARLRLAAPTMTRSCAMRPDDFTAYFAFDSRAAGDLRAPVTFLPDGGTTSAACPVVTEIGL